MRDELSRVGDNVWESVRGDYPGYQFSFGRLLAADWAHACPRLKAMNNLFNRSALKAWAEELLGRQCPLASATVQVTHCRAGDCTTMHTDSAVEDGASGKLSRRLAFVLHLAHPWERRYGGDLVFLNPPLVIHPAFNTMAIFPVGHEAPASLVHLATPVSSAKPPEARRLALTGWYRSRENETSLAHGLALRDKHRDQLADSLRAFVLRVSGIDSQMLPLEYMYAS